MKPKYKKELFKITGGKIPITKVKKRIKKNLKSNELYCKKCGVIHNNHFLVQISPKKTASLCTTCFEWARGKTVKQIKEVCNGKKTR